VGCQVIVLEMADHGLDGGTSAHLAADQAMAGFRPLLSAVLGQSFAIINPYAWMTKTEVIGRIALLVIPII